MTASEVDLIARIVGIVGDALMKLVDAGHPSPEQAVEAAVLRALNEGIEAAAQERAQRQYGPK